MNKISEMQSMMLDMIKWFHEFCRINGIDYYVIGGTMLGAARHHGFIPWDDDIDVGIPRKDYERLLNEKKILFKNEQRYCLESYRDKNADFEYSYAKLYDTNTTLVENCRLRTKRGIFIDVFPLDGIGSDREDALQNYSKIQKYLNFLMTRTCEIRKSRKFIKNVAIIISRLIPNSLISNNKIISKINNMCASRDYEGSAYVGNLVGNWGKKEIMSRSFFGKPTLYDFEDTKVFGPENYDDYLKNVYNNWRQLPPLDKQVSQHDFLLLDLHKSYIDN